MCQAPREGIWGSEWRIAEAGFGVDIEAIAIFPAGVSLPKLVTEHRTWM